MNYARPGIALFVIAGSFALTAAVAPSVGDSGAGAAVTAYLRIEGIDGGATARGYQGWMQVTAFEWSVSTPAGMARAGRTAGRPEFQPVSVKKPFDKAAPFLAQASASGRTFPEAELVFFAAGSTSPTGRVTLNNVSVTAATTGGDASGAAMQSISLSFGRIEWTYVGPRGEQTAGWDVAANRPM